MAIKVYVDSDVVISSLISSSGAAYLLLNSVEDIELIISNHSLAELEIVVDRLKIEKKRLFNLSQNNFKIITLDQSIKRLKNKYSEYVSDPNDTHIVAGATAAQTSFLITYNIKHFKMEKIKKDFNIIVLTPAMFTQYLRSL